MNNPTPGQRAYERDVAKRPLYHDGKARPSWGGLPDYVQATWERNLTDR